MTPDLLDSCATTSFSTHVPDYLKQGAAVQSPAYREGIAARRAGVRMEANPHTASYQAELDWIDGWEEADETLNIPVTTEFAYEMKSWPWFFEKMITGEKKHDMRDKRDRPYAVGDMVKLNEYDPRDGKFSGRWAVFEITYITDNVTPCAMSSTALDGNVAILSLNLVETGPYC